jgi:hypothetical protein
VPTAPELSVVLVNHNGANCLPRTLAALTEHTRADAELIVVDSGSKDRSWRDAEDRGDPVRILRFEDNIGFCSGCNAGARAARAPLVAFVNFDGAVEADWDVPLRDLLADPGVSLAGGMLVDSAGDTVEALGLAIAPNLATYGLSEGVPRSRLPSGPVEVAAVSGALMMVRRAEFLVLGGFHEPLWMYGEEADLALRLHRRIVADPRSAIRHELGHAAGGRGSTTRVYWPSRNRLINAARHLPPHRALGSVAASAAFDAALIATRRDRPTADAVWRGWRDGLRMVPGELRARRMREPAASWRVGSLRSALAQQRRLMALRRGAPAGQL